MRVGTINQSASGVYNAGGWQLVTEREVIDFVLSQSQTGNDMPNQFIYWSVEVNCQNWAQGFKVTSTEPITKFVLGLKQTVGTEIGTLSCYIYSDDGSGKPNALLSTWSTVNVATGLTTSFTDVAFTGIFTPTVGVQYHAVVIWTGGVTNGTTLDIKINNGGYADGSASYTTAGQTWNTYNDTYFKLYTNGPATSYTFSGLNGDVDQEYRLIMMRVCSTASYPILQFNGDTGTNYGYQQLGAIDTVAAATRGSGQNSIYLTGIQQAGTGNSDFVDAIIYAKSGYIRTGIVKGAEKVATTTVSAINLQGVSWSNTADNMTSMTITGGLGVGTHLLLFKRNLLGADASTGIRTGDLNVQGKVTAGEFQKIYQTTLASAATSVTISGLDGNTDVLYELRQRIVGTAGGYGGTTLINNDSTAGHYGYQRITAVNTDLTAERGTISYLATGYGASASIGYSKVLIYAKSGYVRTTINEVIQDVATTTVARADVYGQSWNNTADNITSLVIVGTNIGVGSVIELWALRRKV